MATANDVKTKTTFGSGWLIVWGALLIIAGVLALLMPAIAALATALYFGWLLILGGVFEIAYAIHTRTFRGFGWRLLSGLLTLALGIAILAMPVVGIATLTLLVGSFLLLAGIARSILAFQLRPLPRWGWVLFDGVLSIVLAFLIMAGWPQSSLAFIGLLTGFSLIFTGAWRIALGNSLRARSPSRA
ncbi:MAG TPA: HdeD family acid-resistance protein [Rhodanobacter sp.]